MDQKAMQQAMQLERQYHELEEHSSLVDQELQELHLFLGHLDSFSKSSESKSYSSLGKGVYLQSTINSKELLVEVGLGFFVQKKAEEVREIISMQFKKLQNTKQAISAQQELYLQALSRILENQENLN